MLKTVKYQVAMVSYEKCDALIYYNFAQLNIKGGHYKI